MILKATVAPGKNMKEMVVDGAPDTGWHSPLGVQSLWEMLERRAQLTPDATFVVDEHGHTMTFGELHRRAERVAAGLHAQGVGPGSVVTWQLPTCFDAIALIFALARLWAVQNPLIMMLRHKEVSFICGQVRSDFAITTRSYRGHDHEGMVRSVVTELGRGRVLITDDGLPEADPAALSPYLPAAADRSETRWVFYTSGTTSDPKGVRHSDPGLVAASDNFCAAVQLTADDRLAYLAPIAHVGGILHLIGGVDAGCTLVTTSLFDPERTGRQLRDAQITLGGSGLPFVRRFIEEQRNDPATTHFPEVRAWLVGGSSKPDAFHADVNEALGAGILSSYGLTECPYLTWSTLGDSDRQRAQTEGRPPAGTEIVTVGPDGARTGRNEPGEIWVKAPQLTLGYEDPALNTDAFDDSGFYRTGDVGVIDDDGYLRITGRIKDVIIRNLENISAREIEILLEDFPDAADSTVIGLPDAVTGERVCVVVVARAEGPPITLESVTAYLRARGLNNRKLPTQIEFVDSLPRNPMGKIVKRDLQKLFAAELSAPSTA